MMRQVLIGAALMIVTTFIHSGCTLLSITALETARARRWGMRSAWNRVALVAGLVLLMFLASLVEVVIWGATYIAIGALEGAEKAIYFSMVTFTTLGYGEIVLGPDNRLLASFEAANGIIMFGWTTALIFAFVHRATSANSERVDSGKT
jgi:hypothetical protein